MAKIISRGEDVYNCDTCNRYVRLPDNPLGINVMGRCIITKGCLGSLHKVLNQKLISQISSITPSIEGVNDWFQRKILYTHNQITPALEWVVNHELGNVPIIQVFTERSDPTTLKTTLVETTAYTKEVTTSFATISFSTAQLGVAQCLSLSSTVLEQPTAQVVTDLLLTNKGELTLATTNKTSSIDILVRYTNTSTGESIDVLYQSVDNSPSVLSPWAGTSTILLNGKRFYVRSFNIVTTPAGTAFFQSGRPTPSGFSISIPSLGSAYNTDVILLANSPYTTIDKNTTTYVDVAGINTSNSLAYLSSGNLFVDSSLIRSTYPPIAPL